MTKRPPKPRFSLTVGVIGHRPKDLPADKKLRQKVKADIARALKAVAGAAQQARQDHDGYFEPDPPGVPMLTLVTALAEGADRDAAHAALQQGYAIDVPLPFAREEYKKDFTHKPEKNLSAAAASAATKSAIAEFDELIGHARAVLELPGKRHAPPVKAGDADLDADRAYEAAGLTVLSHADILLAVWDREPSRGRGGTAEMIAEAARVGMPIILVDAKAERPVEVRWRNLMPLPAPIVSVDELPTQTLKDGIPRVVEEVVRPPADPEQREALDRWFDKGLHAFNPRFGYPMLAAFVCVRRPRRTDILPRRPADLAEEYIADAAVVSAPGSRIEALATPFGWADATALYFAQIFRGAFVMNFVFAALAVVCAAASVVSPDNRWVLAEIFLIASVVLNTMLGWHWQWHHRWVEAREVAERLRVALALWAVGLRPTFFAGEEPTWTGWYARAIVRMQGMRAGNLTDSLAAEHALILNLLTRQCSYNLDNAKRMHRLEHRLEVLGICLLFATFAVAVDHFVDGGLTDIFFKGRLPASVNAHKMTIWLSAALPAFATATYGIRVIGDFEGIYRRAERTHQRLDTLIKAMDQDAASLSLLRARARSAADAILGDVASWRLSAESRGLAIPG